ncbi:hypothetical protein L596_018360 [Steinernema carpocapsae]|uniref:tRNA (guanine-N(7)-)-methyltransferase non-catalytic subunit n=1 Tax=Steinernema carpocapsae TaxID=34508 RepID=A0A4U5N549_STECR|nr:hypothetical protein L596_018360 [Steinernema carpocapsae]
MAHIRIFGDRIAIGCNEVLYIFSRQTLQTERRLEIGEMIRDRGLDKNGPYSTSAERQILGLAFSPSGNYICCLTSAKVALVFSVQENFYLHCQPIRLPKAPTAVVFDNKEENIIVSDRAGNVNRFEVKRQPVTYPEGKKWMDINGEEYNIPFHALLGHMSMVLDMCLSEDNQFILTADRDEKLRVSRYPQAYIIDHFCLGHESYVKSIQTFRKGAFTSGGDSVIRAWNLITGKCIAHSERLSEDPVRHLRILGDEDSIIRIAVAFEKSNVVKTLIFNGPENIFVEDTIFKAPENIFDLAYHPDGILFVLTTKNAYQVSSKGEFISFDGPYGENRLIRLLEEDLKISADPIEKLEKNVAFNNMEEYLQRKEERKEKRKRKHEGEEEPKKLDV